VILALRELGVQTQRLRVGRPLPPRSVVVSWGEPYRFPLPEGGVLLNPPEGFVGKMTELRRLKESGVKVPEMAFILPAPNTGEWLARTRHHVGGEDLLHPPERPDFWTRKLNFTKEFRVHVWKGLTMKVGMKVPMEGMEPHVWIRSRAAGWKISYGQDAQEAIRQKVRDAAKAATKVLALDFGAVDVGVCRDGTPVVLEVNRAPGADGATSMKYAEKIKEVCCNGEG